VLAVRAATSYVLEDGIGFAGSGYGSAPEAMEGFQQYSDIILFAMIAVFLVLRLRSVLGRRTGYERRRDPFMGRAETAADNKVVTLEPSKVTVMPPPASPGDAVTTGIEAIRRADPGFDPAQFLGGARAAFELIVAAFAKGDKAALRPLLSDAVFGPFSSAIDERAAAKETLETRIVRLASAEIVEAGLSGRAAEVTVKLVSEQINVTRAVDGSIVDGNPEQPAEKTDFWSFARDTRSGDPNWVLVATSSG
jgi:predicted lipid-binding transport protein (Tim44 family)